MVVGSGTQNLNSDSEACKASRWVDRSTVLLACLPDSARRVATPNSQNGARSGTDHGLDHTDCILKQWPSKKITMPPLQDAASS